MLFSIEVIVQKLIQHGSFNSLASFGIHTGRLKRISKRLHSLASGTKTLNFSIQMLETILRFKNIAGKLVDALNEVTDALNILNDLRDSSINKSTINNVQVMAIATSAWRDRLYQLARDLESHYSSVLLDSK